jgi:hypothetical protein
MGASRAVVVHVLHSAESAWRPKADVCSTGISSPSDRRTFNLCGATAKAMKISLISRS